MHAVTAADSASGAVSPRLSRASVIDAQASLIATISFPTGRSGVQSAATFGVGS